MDDFMAVADTPKLPPLMIINQGKYSYVTTYKITWDKTLRQPRRVPGQNKTVGKIVGGGTEGVIEWNSEFLDEHPELAGFITRRVLKGQKGSKNVYDYEFEPIDEMISLREALNLKRLSAGATWALDNIVAGSSLTKTLEQIFGKFNRHKKLLSLAYYMYLTSNSATHLYEDFARKHRLPYQKPLTPGQISRLFAKITPSEIDSFLRELNEKVRTDEERDNGKKNVYYALDSTSISTHSVGLTKAQWGHNKDGDALKQINLVMLVNQENGHPVYYRSYTGNTPDVSTVSNLISEITRIGVNRNAILVSDKGYSSVHNINQFLLRGIDFILNCRTGYLFARQIIAESIQKLDDFCSYNPQIQCYCLTQKHIWSYPTYDKTASGRAVKDKTTLYIHVYLDKDIRAEGEKNLLRGTILPILEKMRNNQPLTQEEESAKNRFIKDDGTGSFRTNIREKNEYLMNKGIRILVSNRVSDPVEAWMAYYERERVEDLFRIAKQTIGGNRYRTSKNETTEGKTFVMFLASAIGMMFRQRVKHATANGMKMPYDSDNKLLANLDSIEQTVFREGCYYTPVTGVQRRIMEALDIPMPSTEIFGKLSKEEEETDEDDNIQSLDELDIILSEIEK